MCRLSLLAAIVALAAFGAVSSGSGSVVGQEPPVGNPPEADDEIQHQIAEFLLAANPSGEGGPGGSGIEEDPELWALFDQQQPDMSVTLGLDSVGGVVELPHEEGAPMQTADSTRPDAWLLAATVGFPSLFLGGVIWYMARGKAPG